MLKGDKVMGKLEELLKNEYQKCYNYKYKIICICDRCCLEVTKMDVKELAIGIISYYNNANQQISNLKLQKILYYIQGYAMRLNKSIAFDSKIYNWPYGPVIEEIYFEYNEYRAKNIVLKEDDRTSCFLKDKSAQAKLILDVLNCCADKTAYELVRMTHSEDPWKNSKLHEEITIESIGKYFSNHDPLNIGA